MHLMAEAVRGTATRPRSRSAEADRGGGLRQKSIVLAMLVAVAVVDQAIKWWAWRHAPTAMINYGGGPLVPSSIDGWYGDPVTGALLDLFGCGLLSLAVALLIWRRRPAVLLVAGALMLGGWISNLLDRLGMHFWTAPGSVRGAIDFIRLGGLTYNVADMFILGGTLLFVLALTVGYKRRWATEAAPAAGSLSPATRHRLRRSTRMLALAGAVGLITIAGIGATNDGGVTAPTTSAGSYSQSG
jgi:lipoprotein signal peptidase